MRICFSYFLIGCFLLVFASASYLAMPAHAVAIGAEPAGSFLTTKEATSSKSDELSADEEHSSDSCSCKEMTGAKKFVCSVSLAFTPDASFLLSPDATKERFKLQSTTELKSYIDHLKRPPRTIL